MLTSLLVLLSLVLINGLFAMSEIAIVSARRVRLAQMASSGSAGARRALALASEPTRFLSSVQVGITTIGVLTGAIGQVTIARQLRAGFELVPALAPYAEVLGVALMVVGVAYVSLILGELVPKRLALTQPERIATLVAGPMTVLAAAGRPLVHLLSASTDTILRLAGVRADHSPAVTTEEIRVLLREGTEEGVFEVAEHEMMTNVLSLGDRQVGGVLTPRAEVAFVNLRDPIERTREILRRVPHAVLPLCDGDLDQVLGVVHATRVLDQLLDGGPPDLRALVERPLIVPETMTLMTLLKQFKVTHLPMALVVSEFGHVKGLVSLTDVVAAIVGGLPSPPGEAPMVVQRDDGSWLLDGGLDLDAVIRLLGPGALDADDRQHSQTLGGVVMRAMRRVPTIGDGFSRGGYRFEVVDMDANRVDRVLVSADPTLPAGDL